MAISVKYSTREWVAGLLPHFRVAFVHAAVVLGTISLVHWGGQWTIKFIFLVFFAAPGGTVLHR